MPLFVDARWHVDAIAVAAGNGAMVSLPAKLTCGFRPTRRVASARHSSKRTAQDCAEARRGARLLPSRLDLCL